MALNGPKWNLNGLLMVLNDLKMTNFYQKINKRESYGQKDELMARGTRLYIQIHVQMRYLHLYSYCLAGISRPRS